jgi:WhiB family redox-sensing transcriptional regulator
VIDIDDDAPPAPMFDGSQPCAAVDPELWFPAKGESANVAKAICATCPFRAPCLEWGLKHEREGVWGGMSGSQRAAHRKLHRIPLVSIVPPQLPDDETTHGSHAGVRWHERHGTPACGPCRAFRQDRQAGANR